MEIEKLFQGPGLVIDDKVFENSGDSIVKIVSFLESKGIPLAKYDSVMSFQGENCRQFSFVLLDWELVAVEDEMGMPIPGAKEAAKTAKEGLLNFLKELLNKCYLPIFIFSNDSSTRIEEELRKADILINKEPLPILIKHKGDLISDQGILVMEKIQEWVDKMPSIYVLKEWENAIGLAKTDTFKSLANTHNWPTIMWDAAHEDHVDESEEIFELLSQNVFGRMLPINIEKAQLDKDDTKVSDRDALMNVLSFQRFDTRKNVERSTTGDFYKIDSSYFVNIRPACDCVARGTDTDVYLVEAQQITNAKAKSCYLIDYGNFSEKSIEALIGPIYKKKFYRILFHSTKVRKYDEVKDQKVGRILPPFIRHITERYSLYMQRQGLPRLPLEVFYTKEEIAQFKEKKDATDEQPG